MSSGTLGRLFASAGGEHSDHPEAPQDSTAAPPLGQEDGHDRSTEESADETLPVAAGIANPLATEDAGDGKADPDEAQDAAADVPRRMSSGRHPSLERLLSIESTVSAQLEDYPETMEESTSERLNESLTQEDLKKLQDRAPAEDKESVVPVADMEASGIVSATLSWDFSITDQDLTDLDVSAVVFDRQGRIIDACYYNQKWILDGSLRHSGDDRFGAMLDEEKKDESRNRGAGEAVKVLLDQLPANAVAVCFVVNCYRGGNLSDIKERAGATVGCKDGPTFLNLNFSEMQTEDETGLILGFLYRTDSSSTGWIMRRLVVKCFAFTFTQSVERMRRLLQRVGAIDKTLVAPVLSGNRVFTMSKGDYARLPSGVRYVSVGLGWTTRGSREIDLDTSAVISGYTSVAATSAGPNGIGLSKRELVHLDTVWFSQRYDKLTGGNFIIRSLDNVTGEGKGDDEVIHVDLRNAPLVVREISFCVNIYDKRKGFDRCKDSYIRLMLDAGGEGFGGKEVARFPISGRIHTTGLVFACLYRTGVDWSFRTIGEGCWGRHVHHEKGNTVPVCLHQVPGEDIKVYDAENEEDANAEGCGSRSGCTIA